MDTLDHIKAMAQDGNPEAQFKLGQHCDNGIGTPQDFDEAMRWYRAAAEQGVVEAHYNIGVLYDHGRGVEQDYPVAHMWFSISQQRCTPVENERAKKVKGSIEETMNPAELERARMLYRNWESNRDAPSN